MDATYQNLSRLNTASRPSLVDYMNDSAGNTNALQAVVEKAKKADELQGSFNDFHAQLGTDKTAQLLESIEKGEAPLDGNAIANYLNFNRQKLATELSNLARSLGLDDNETINIESDNLALQGINSEKLERYLEKDTRLSSLISQTAKLSSFSEWSKATEYAKSLQENGDAENAIQQFLTDARKVVTSENLLSFNRDGFVFESDKRTESLIEKYEEKRT